MSAAQALEKLTSMTATPRAARLADHVHAMRDEENDPAVEVWRSPPLSYEDGLLVWAEAAGAPGAAYVPRMVQAIVDASDGCLPALPALLEAATDAADYMSCRCHDDRVCSVCVRPWPRRAVLCGPHRVEWWSSVLTVLVQRRNGWVVEIHGVHESRVYAAECALGWAPTSPWS